MGSMRTNGGIGGNPVIGNYLVNISLLMLVVSHICGSFWRLGGSVNWAIANALDSVGRFALPILLMTAGITAKQCVENSVSNMTGTTAIDFAFFRSFFKDRLRFLAPFLAGLLIYFFWGGGRYDGLPVSTLLGFDDILHSDAYPFYWAILLFIYDIFAFFLFSFASKGKYKYLTDAFIVLWFIFAVIWTEPAVLRPVFDVPNWIYANSKIVLDFLNNNLILKLSGYYVFGFSFRRQSFIDAVKAKAWTKKAVCFAAAGSLLATYLVTWLEAPLFGLDPYDHTLRDYIRPNIAIYSLSALALLEISRQPLYDRFGFLKNFFEGPPPYSYYFILLYLSHSALIEIMASFPDLPPFGLLYKLILILAAGFAFSWFLGYIIGPLRGEDASGTV
jgi:hypothetical protein